MKFMLLVHHDEVAFDQISKDKQQQMLAESIALTHQLHANGQYLSASPLQPAATAVIVRVRARQIHRHRRAVHRDPRTDRRLFSDRCQGSQ